MIKTIKTCYCDRCGKEMPEDHIFRCDTYPNTVVQIFRDGELVYADICDKCKESFCDWWQKPSEDVKFKLEMLNSNENIKLGFVEPSGTYNIVLSKIDLKFLESGKPVLIRPLKIGTTYKNILTKDTVTKELGALSIDFYGKNEEPHPIQYVSIRVKQESEDKE